MPAAGRRSNTQAAGRAATAPPRGLPPYQTSAHPLTPAAQRSLHALPQKHNLKRLREHMAAASTSIPELASEVTDRLVQKADFHRRQREKRAKQGLEDDGAEGDEKLNDMRSQVGQLTDELEAKMRALIDVEDKVIGMEEVLAKLGADVAAAPGSTQSTQASQGRRGRRARAGGDENDEGEDDDVDMDTSYMNASYAETQDGHTTENHDGERVGPVHRWQRELQERRQRYAVQSMRNKYATHNDYIGFKRMVHDAQHPGDDAPPVPHADTWFPPSPDHDAAAPQPAARTTRHHASREARGEYGGDDDDDVAITADKTSLTCPLTLRPFKDPVTSKKCPHSFEKAAILDMIGSSNARIGGAGRRGAGQRAVKCPVCEQMLAAADLAPDPVLQRRIRRLQEMAAAEHDDDDDGEEGGAGRGGKKGSQRQVLEEIDDNEDGQDVDGFARLEDEHDEGPRQRSGRVKAERRSRARAASRVPGTQVVD